MFPETIDQTGVNPLAYVEATCRGKSDELLGRSPPLLGPTDILICADTIIAQGDRILEKPASEEDAFFMLKSLSGTSHAVLTAVRLSRGLRSLSFVERTTVHFAALDDSAIRAYVATGDPMDKAGGYGYQSQGASFISGIEGCYYNVVGLPAHALCTHLIQLIKTE